MLEIILIIGAIASAILGVIALVLTFIKPFRKWIKDNIKERECAKNTDKCLLRNEILSIYYKNQRDCEIKQYAYENLALLYKQYKKLDGNSFVDHIWEEVQDWKITRN